VVLVIVVLEWLIGELWRCRDSGTQRASGVWKEEKGL
jgi:hypothetical protein